MAKKKMPKYKVTVAYLDPVYDTFIVSAPSRVAAMERGEMEADKKGDCRIVECVLLKDEP